MPGRAAVCSTLACSTDTDCSSSRPGTPRRVRRRRGRPPRRPVPLRWGPTSGSSKRRSSWPSRARASSTRQRRSSRASGPGQLPWASRSRRSRPCGAAPSPPPPSSLHSSPRSPSSARSCSPAPSPDRSRSSPPRLMRLRAATSTPRSTGGRLDEEQATMIAAIDRYSRLQLDLITNVLDFARLSSGQISFQVERFALAPLLAEIEALHARRLQNPRLALTVRVDPDLPMFETDRVKLQEIVHNLVDNAVKFTEVGRITLVQRAGSDSSRVVIEVGDTGPGIPAEDLDTIFDAFHQVGESSTRRTNGVGLGLSIVKQLANALGGTVSVTSRIGEGSTFRIDVPCCLRAPGAPTPEAVPAV